MIDEVSDRLLMSDSIKGMIPELEEEKIKDLNDAFLVAVFEIIYDDSEEINVLAGKVEGISFESQGDMKIDVCLETRKAYDTIKKYTTSGLSCRMLHVHHGDDELCIEGPFKFSSAKLLDFDVERKMCTLGIDLVKIDHI
jgi:hypothetical protein